MDTDGWTFFFFFLYQDSALVGHKRSNGLKYMSTKYSPPYWEPSATHSPARWHSTCSILVAAVAEQTKKRLHDKPSGMHILYSVDAWGFCLPSRPFLHQGSSGSLDSLGRVGKACGSLDSSDLLFGALKTDFAANETVDDLCGR